MIFKLRALSLFFRWAEANTAVRFMQPRPLVVPISDEQLTKLILILQLVAKKVDYTHENRHNLLTMVSRTVKLSKFQSFFLFGARGTGKSTLLRQFY